MTNKKKLIKSFRLISMYIARFVRDELETLHANNVVMNDTTMEEINRRIRSWIYNYFRVMMLPDKEKNKRLDSEQPAPYWEETEFDEIDKIIDKTYKNLLTKIK